MSNYAKFGCMNFLNRRQNQVVDFEVQNSYSLSGVSFFVALLFNYTRLPERYILGKIYLLRID